MGEKDVLRVWTLAPPYLDVPVSEDSTLREVRAALEAETGIPADRQRLQLARRCGLPVDLDRDDLTVRELRRAGGYVRLSLSASKTQCSGNSASMWQCAAVCIFALTVAAGYWEAWDELEHVPIKLSRLGQGRAYGVIALGFTLTGVCMSFWHARLPC